MLRKGSSVSNITGISSNTSTNPGLSPSSVSSSPHHHHRRLHDGSHYRSSSASGRESVAQQHHRASYYHHTRTSTPPSSSALLEGAVASTPLRRGNLSHSTSTSDISSPSILGCTTVPTGELGGFNILKSPSRHSQHHHQQQHCCGCACNGSGNNTPTVSSKLPTDAINSPSSNTLLRHVVSSTLPRSCSPRAHSPQNHHQQPLVLHPSSTSHNHSTAQLLCSGDCHADSHPRLTTTTHLNPNCTSGSNNKIWIFGKEEEDDEYCAQDDEDDERRDTTAPVIRRRRLISSSTATGGTGLGSSSHGYSHTVPLPSPVIAGATVPCQAGGTGCTQYNAGAIPSTPISTTHTAGFNNTALFKLQNSSSSSSVVASPPDLLLPMDFIQVLIHQHAKTIVALQDLQREVSTLKDFRTSLLHSLPASGAPPTASASSGLSEAVWTTGGANGGVGGASAPAVSANSSPSSSGGGGSSAPKIPHPDSGFSTETKSTNQKSDAESEDELYSLLSLIQCKVQESIIRNDFLSSHQSKAPTTTGDLSTTRSGRKSDTSKPKERLGKLDKVLGNCDKVEFRKDFISRDVIRGVLSAEKTELQRQLFFALVKIENLKSLSKEQKTIDSRVYALSQENEQLRYKLKEMEIELEGTKATLRILQKNSYSPALANRSSSTTVLPEASSRTPATSNHPHLQHLHHHQHSTSRLVPPSPMWETDSLDVPDPTDFAIPGATTPVVATSTTVASSPSASTTTRQRLIQKLSDIESINNSSSSGSSPHSPATNNNSTIRLSTNNNYSYSSSGTHSSSSSKKSPAPKPPVIIEHAVSSTSPPSSNNNNNTITAKQQKSASPVGNKSMSSIKSNNSSIPIAVSRLKASKAGTATSTNPSSSSTSSKPSTGKVKANTTPNTSTPPGANTGHIENGGNTFWANWFRS